MKMHATMLSAKPSICYLKPQSLAVIEKVKILRQMGLQCYFTMDAGPNVKILCPSSQSQQIHQELQSILSHIHILGIGGNAKISSNHLSIE